MCRVLSQLLGKHLFDSIYHVLGDLVIFGLLDLCLSLIDWPFYSTSMIPKSLI